ncbi:9696_t:CDS:1 [Racocetra persica]|uniref:9696_t:CDS:1 n=1 Tax=Racocetra persica TaxID=160502 RepID=A0ACA9PAZ3_9GLOM|nr:9696_t:CDS:1 [Racocetra persica]
MPELSCLYLCSCLRFHAYAQAQTFCWVQTYIWVATPNDICSEVLQFEKNKAFTKEMQEDVKFYISWYYFSTILIRKVLKQKYLSHSIFFNDLYKEIRKYKPLAQANESDASKLYEELLAKQ